jgi:hypothetical protein
MATLVEKVANANDCLEALDEIFIQTGEGVSNVAQEGSINS